MWRCGRRHCWKKSLKDLLIGQKIKKFGKYVLKSQKSPEHRESRRQSWCFNKTPETWGKRTWHCYLQVLIEANDGSRCEGQRQEMWEWKPEPELSEHQQTHDGGHVRVSSPRLQGDGHVPATYKRRERKQFKETFQQTELHKTPRDLKRDQSIAYP